MLVKDFRVVEFDLALNGLNKLKDKESAYGTTWEVYMKYLKCYKCTKQNMKAIQIL